MTINNRKRIFVDVGSSTVKVYKHNENSPKLLFSRSIPFKEGFDPEIGISENNKRELMEVLTELMEKHPDYSIKLYATALYRKLTPKAQVALKDEIFERTGLFFNIISHELENFYLEIALVGSYVKDEAVLLVNIGGGSTELVVMYGNEAIERHNIDIGVGTVIAEFPRINEKYSKTSLEDVAVYIKGKLPVLQNEVKVAFYNGGELTYMKLAKYNLKRNVLFDDKSHPSILSLEDLCSRNLEIYSKVALEELKTLMPENPKWMLGARPCSAIAQAIFENYNVETIVPSDSNLIDGVARQEFRYVTISGIFRKHLNYILRVKQPLLSPPQPTPLLH